MSEETEEVLFKLKVTFLKDPTDEEMLSVLEKIMEGARREHPPIQTLL